MDKSKYHQWNAVLIFLLFVCLFVFVLAGAASGAEVLRMATTTSTDNTGLLDYLAPLLLQEKNIELQWVSVGTGKALEYGRNGDVDVLLVHAPELEKKFVADGWGVNRRQVMYNDFIVVGPASDPAGVKGMAAADALKGEVSIEEILSVATVSFASLADLYAEKAPPRKKAVWKKQLENKLADCDALGRGQPYFIWRKSGETVPAEPVE